MTFKFDVEAVRAQFPACKLEVEGSPIAYLDAPGGTQVPQRVIDRIMKYLISENANEGGYFKAGMLAESIEEEARQAVADLLGSEACEVGFSCSSTQNNFNLAHALARRLQPGDEIITTEMEHRCNSAPWNQLGKDGFTVKVVKLDLETQQMDMDDYLAKLSPKTRVVALNWASNGLGTVTDVRTMIAKAHEVGAITVVDAVHYAPHFPVDVKDIDTDVLICSAYKWFGPHIGVMYMKKELLEDLDFYNVMCEDIATGPRKLHMGTPQYELLAGVAEAVDFIASFGEDYVEAFKDKVNGLSGRRKNIVAAMEAIDHYEQDLAKQLRAGLRAIPGVTLYGPSEGQPRTPTVVFTMEGKMASDVTKVLGAKGINAWDGDYYAVEIIDVLGLRNIGGMVRLGLAPYCTQADIDRVLSTIRTLATGV